MPASMTFAPAVTPLPLGEYTTVIGAGGLLTGIMGSSDGTLVARLDTQVAHSLGPNADTWQRESIPGQTFALNDIDLTYDTNVFAIAAAWSNSAVKYQVTMGYTWVKKPGAATYTKTAVPLQTTTNPNDGSYRLCGNPLDVCPTDPSIALVGFQGGAYRLTAYGDTATPIPTSTLPAPSPAGSRYIFRWDRSQAGRVHAFVLGSGFYTSSDYGVNWTKNLAAGVPTAASHMKVHPTTGLVMLAGAATDGVDGQVAMWNGSSWSLGTRTDGGGAAQLFAVEFSALHAGRAYGVQAGGAYRVSLDSGATWDDVVALQIPEGNEDIRWQAKTYTYFTASEIVEHPVTGNLRMGAGVGCFEIRNPPSNTTEGTAIAAFGLSRGIENMVAHSAIIAPNGDRGITQQDKGLMTFSENGIGQVFPRYYGPLLEIQYSTGADYAPEDTAFWATSFVQIQDGDARGHGWTADRCKTWTVTESLADQTGGKGWGDIALLSKDVAIAVQGITGGFDQMAASKVQNGVYYTRNFRAAVPAWTQLMIGNNNAVFGGYLRTISQKRFVKHPYEPGVVYFYNAGDPEAASGQRLIDHQACVGIYKFTDNGTTITVERVRTSRLYGFARELFALKFVHGGAAGRLLVGCGDDSQGAFRSTDGGANWSELTGTDNLGMGTKFGEVYGISAGAPHPSSSNPTLWAVGTRITTEYYFDGTDYTRYGLWESRDNGATWIRRANIPGGYFKPVNDMCASMHRYGDLTLTTSGQGAAQLLLAA